MYNKKSVPRQNTTRIKYMKLQVLSFKNFIVQRNIMYNI